MTACWRPCATQSDGWQKNRRTLLLIESSQNSHSNMEKPNYKTDTRCPLFFPTSLDSILEKSNVELSHLLLWLFFSTAEIHKCSSEVINLNIMISHSNRKQWFKIYESIFFFRCGFCLLCLCKLWFHESKETIMFSISKVPEKTNWEAASSLPPGFKAGHFSKKVDNTAGVYGADRQVDGVVELSLWITASTIGEWPDSPWLWSHLCQVQVHRRAGKDPGLKHWLQCRIPPLLFLSRKETMQK